MQLRLQWTGKTGRKECYDLHFFFLVLNSMIQSATAYLRKTRKENWKKGMHV
jgi:hypothetical protein